MLSSHHGEGVAPVRASARQARRLPPVAAAVKPRPSGSLPLRALDYRCYWCPKAQPLSPLPHARCTQTQRRHRMRPPPPPPLGREM
jgi:hypothetical protein